MRIRRRIKISSPDLSCVKSILRLGRTNNSYKRTGGESNYEPTDMCHVRDTTLSLWR